MEQAEINLERLCFVRRGLLSSKAISFEHVRALQSTRLMSLADEVGLIVLCDDAPLYLRETDPGFAGVAAYFGLNAQWGDDWIQRTEQGHRFEWCR